MKRTTLEWTVIDYLNNHRDDLYWHEINQTLNNFPYRIINQKKNKRTRMKKLKSGIQTDHITKSVYILLSSMRVADILQSPIPIKQKYCHLFTLAKLIKTFKYLPPVEIFFKRVVDLSKDDIKSFVQSLRHDNWRNINPRHALYIDKNSHNSLAHYYNELQSNRFQMKVLAFSYALSKS